MTIVPKEEEMAVDFSSNGVIDVDAFLATVPPAKDKLPLVSSPPPMSPVPSTHANQTPCPTTNVAITPPMPAPNSSSTSSLPASPYPQSVLDQCRDILVPLVERNAKLRKPEVDEETVKRQAFRLLSDKLCSDFINLAKQVRAQISMQPPPQRTPSTDDLQGRKRGRERSHDSPGPPRKSVKLESPKKMVLDDGVVATTAPSPPVEDIGMNENTEIISSEHLSEPPMSGADEDVILPPPPQEPSTAPPGLCSATEQHPNISTTERKARTVMDILLPLQENIPASSLNHMERGSPPVHATIVAYEEEDVVSSSLPPPAPSNTEPEHGAAAVALPAPHPSSRSSSPSYAKEANATDVAAETGASTHESERSDTSRLDAESVTRLLDATSEDERVAYAPIDDDMGHEQSADVLEPPVVYPPCLVPGVWQAVMGQPRPGIETTDFFVDDATADAIERWSRRHDSLRFVERRIHGIVS